MSGSDSDKHHPASTIPLVREDFGRPWRWLTVFAGLLMVVAFFLPMTGQKINFGKQIGPDTIQYRGPTDPDELPDIPFVFWRAMASRLASVPVSWWPANLSSLLYLTLTCGLHHFWGLALLAYSLAQLGRRTRTRQVIQVVTLIASLLAAIGLLAFISYWFFLETLQFLTPAYIIIYGLSTLFVLTPMLHAILAIRQGPWAYLYHGFIAALTVSTLLSLVQLMALYAGPQPRRLHGLLLAFVAAILLLIGRIGEARAISRLSWIKTCLCLLLLRLRRAALPLGRCPRCAYNLFGLPEPRCPECGRPFRPEEIGISPEPAQIASR